MLGKTSGKDVRRRVGVTAGLVEGLTMSTLLAKDCGMYRILHFLSTLRPSCFYMTVKLSLYQWIKLCILYDVLENAYKYTDVYIKGVVSENT